MLLPRPKMFLQNPPHHTTTADTLSEKRTLGAQKFTRRLEFSAVLVDFSKRLADFHRKPTQTFSPCFHIFTRQKRQAGHSLRPSHTHTYIIYNVSVTTKAADAPPRFGFYSYICATKKITHTDYEQLHRIGTKIQTRLI